jgi:DegV family protein with EDD domain
MSIRIVTDSTCDLPDSVVSELGITVVPLYINFGNQGYLDGIEISRSEFYRRLPNAYPLPSTAAPGVDAFRQVYEALAKDGATEILSTHISKSLSATVEVAAVAAGKTRSVPVTVVDSGQLSLGLGFQAVNAAQLAAQGATLQTITKTLEEQRSRTHVFAALETLEFLRRSGRMSRIVATFGTLLQIKPLLHMYNGNPHAERVRTARGATKRLLGILEGLGKLEQVALVHTNAPDKAAELRSAAAELLPPGEIESVDITPVLGANIGPGAVGFACVVAGEE